MSDESKPIDLQPCACGALTKYACSRMACLIGGRAEQDATTTPAPPKSFQQKMEGFAARSGVDLAAIQERTRRAMACPKHRYEIGASPFALGAKYRCAHCGDERRLMDIGLYVQGYQAAGGDPRDVCPEWKVTP